MARGLPPDGNLHRGDVRRHRGAFTVFQRSLIYGPAKVQRVDPAIAGLERGQFRNVDLKTHDGLTLHGWHIFARGKIAGTEAAVFLFFCGNGGNRGWRGDEYSLLPISLCLVDRYPSVDRIKTVTCPILQVHGLVDSIVTHERGAQLFAAAPAKSSGGIAKTWVDLPRADHNNVLQTDRPRFERGLREFLKKLAIGG